PVLGGGSIIWGTWSFRALPIDFRLRTHFQRTGQLDWLEQNGYAVPDWPVAHSEMEPFYNVAETLLAVSGDRSAMNQAVTGSAWYQHFSAQDYFATAGNWTPTFPFPCPAYPRTPIGHFVYQGMANARDDDGRPANLYPVQLPTGIVNPATPTYETRRQIQVALDAWGNGGKPDFWNKSAEVLWSER